MRYLIVGSSAAGISAAKTLRKMDNSGEILIISKDEEIYSRCLLHHFISGERTEERLSFVTDGFMEKNQISWEKGKEVYQVVSEEKLVKTKDGKEYNYDKLLIATGSRAIIPAVTGLKEGKQVCVLRDLEDARVIKKMSQRYQRILVIGAGLVGIDLATSLNDRGNQVLVVELAPNILPLQLDRQAAGNYERLLKDSGIEIYTNNVVNEVILDENNNVVEVVLKNEKNLNADMVVIATGVSPNTSLVAETAVEVKNGILVDEHQETSIKDIYAAGDVCQSYEIFKGKKILTPIWPAAVKQGEVAAYNMVGLEKKLVDNFAFKNSMRFVGLSTISYGQINQPDNNYKVKSKEKDGYYQKVIYRNGMITGAIVQGDIEDAGVIGELIKEKIDVSPYLDNIFAVTYADFFKEERNGSFSYKLMKK